MDEKISIEKNKKSPTKCTSPLILACIATTLGTSVPTGYHLGVTNTPAEYIESWCNETLIEQYDIHLTPGLSKLLFATVVSIYLIGGAIGSIAGSWIADKYGRKIPLLISGTQFLFSAFLFLMCRPMKSVELLLLGRFFVGIACGICTTAVPMYLSEISPIKLRGPMATSFAFGVCLGIPVAQLATIEEVVGSKELWEFALAGHVVFSMLCLLAYPALPESPMYLYIIAKNNQKATNTLIKLRGTKKSNVIDEELSLMEQEVKQTCEKRSIYSVLTTREYLLPITLVIALQSGQQLSGINVVYYYSVSIFKSAGLSAVSASWANVGAGILTIVISCFTPLLMGKFNRRPIIMWSCYLSGVCLTILTISLLFINLAPWLPLMSVALIYGFIITFGIGLDPIPYFIASELFESAPRPAAMAIGCIASWMANFLTGITFPSLQDAWGPFVFLPFAFCCFALAILLQIYLPETRGIDSSIIAPLVNKGFKSKPLIKANMLT